MCPSVSHDQKYLFFHQGDKHSLRWVFALRQQLLNAIFRLVMTQFVGAIPAGQLI
jgi:hypothetical protein